MENKKKVLEPVNFKNIIRSQKNKTVRNLPNFVIFFIRKILQEKTLNRFIKAKGDKFGVDFAQGAHDYFKVAVKVHGLEKLDPDGKYIFVCNHPIGGFDFSAVITTLSKKYANIKVIANKVLTELDNIKELIIPVGVFDKSDKEANARIDAMMKDHDTQIMTFPAGLVARKIKGEIQEMPWHRSFVRHAVQYQREVVPIYIDHFNSRLFYNIARFRKFLGIKANIELFFLIGEQFKKANSTIPIYIGEPIHYSTFTKEKSHLEWAQELREHTCKLKDNWA